ncbi:MAG: recombination protein RecR [Anaerolineae bacterium]|jgi:recombination protein RecR|nr:recombination protein RecR [Anaerolineae bacterium]MBT4309128.1 recombination protein RecR [Anaerolineae bacterium]MBT4460131.1 recombination protein RecR [Anaerolineae bacterium]MBT4843172.1 recombination protein RecR [Anaerolineae bacterium]MBT6062207.1 recombination protein RecR [Anaerolineae bacterium]
MILPEPLQNLVNAFERLPGIGPKSASRLAFYLLRDSSDLGQELSDALDGFKDRLAFCPECFNIMIRERERCDICEDSQRDNTVICVVEDALDVLSLERTAGFKGKYHVLHGALSPIEGVGPDDLKIHPLLERVKDSEVNEIILATNPSMEGDATALYLDQRLASFNLRVTRLARGLPIGGDLEYADQNTLLRALSGRQEMDS